MTDALAILDQVRIASPCPVLWEEMIGDERVRRCGQCDCRVYNLAAMTALEGVTLLRETEGSLCIQLWRREDGTLITADCTVGLREQMRRVRRRIVAVGALIASFFAMPGCSRDIRSDDSGACVTATPTANPPASGVRPVYQRLGGAVN